MMCSEQSAHWKVQKVYDGLIELRNMSDRRVITVYPKRHLGWTKGMTLADTSDGLKPL